MKLAFFSIFNAKRWDRGWLFARLKITSTTKYRLSNLVNIDLLTHYQITSLYFIKRQKLLNSGPVSYLSARRQDEGRDEAGDWHSTKDSKNVKSMTSLTAHTQEVIYFTSFILGGFVLIKFITSVMYVRWSRNWVSLVHCCLFAVFLLIIWMVYAVERTWQICFNRYDMLFCPIIIIIGKLYVLHWRGNSPKCLRGAPYALVCSLQFIGCCLLTSWCQPEKFLDFSYKLLRNLKIKKKFSLDCKSLDLFAGRRHEFPNIKSLIKSLKMTQFTRNSVW